MGARKSFPEDPVVREVREIRRRLWAEAGGTVEGLLRLLDQRMPACKRKSTSRKRKTAD